MIEASTGRQINLITGATKDVRLSTLRLNDTSDVKRMPKHPERERPRDFLDSFDFTTIYYDCFWDDVGRDILCIGPTPTNLKTYYKKAVYRALPSGEVLKSKHFIGLTLMTTQLKDAPIGTTHIELKFANGIHVLDVQASSCDDFAGENLMFAMSKNNELKWIRFWADYHVRNQNVSSIILFDNGSDLYTIEDVKDVLCGVTGLKKVLVVNMPYPFCSKDETLKVNPYWAHFLQISMMSIVLRRFGMKTKSILNVDIDELANSSGKSDVFTLAEQSSRGILAMKGIWVEPIADESFGDHRDFKSVAKDEKQYHCDSGKWAIDPKRKWFRRLSVFPYWHWIQNRPKFGRRYVEGVHFWHFKGINTNWKLNRAKPMEFDPEIHVKRDIAF